jgi:small-conductance mechanosensitive channel
MWYTAWIEAVGSAIEAGAGRLPAVAGGLLLALVGWLTAKLCSRWARAATERLLGRLGSSSAIRGAIDASGTRIAAPKLAGLVVFWAVLLVFVAAAVEVVGLPVMTDLLGRMAVWVPNLVAAAAVMLGGLVVARLVRSAVGNAAERARVPQAAALSSVVHGVIVLIAAVIALEQIGINGRVLELTIAVTVGSVLASVALAFGLGARGAVANLVSARYAAQLCRVGQVIRVGDVEGTVIEVGAVAVLLETPDGQVAVPTMRFHDTVVHLPAKAS